MGTSFFTGAQSKQNPYADEVKICFWVKIVPKSLADMLSSLADILTDRYAYWQICSLANNAHRQMCSLADVLTGRCAYWQLCSLTDVLTGRYAYRQTCWQAGVLTGKCANWQVSKLANILCSLADMLTGRYTYW